MKGNDVHSSLFPLHIRFPQVPIGVTHILTLTPIDLLGADMICWFLSALDLLFYLSSPAALPEEEIPLFLLLSPAVQSEEEIPPSLS